MKRNEVNEFIIDNPKMSDEEMAKKCNLTVRTIKEKRKCLIVKQDRHQLTVKATERSANAKYRIALEEIETLERQLSTVLKLESTPQEYEIPSKYTTDGEATAFMVASDWHLEERVDPDTVSNLNEYNPKIAQSRIESFFQNGVLLTKMFQRDTHIDTIVLALLGDFINNHIHEEMVESNYLSPMDAVIKAREILTAGIQYLLDNTDCNLIIPCHSGNHARVTEKQRVSTLAGHSLEFLLYNFLESEFRGNERVQFLIAKGYFTHLSIYGDTIRLHHGDAIRYSGGVGGIYIPVNKAIAQWNKAKWASLDIFAHWHQQRDGGNFICNGSVVGWNAYAVRIKADFESPKQTFFLWDRKRKKSIVAPIDL